MAFLIKKTLHAKEQEREDVQEQRKIWKEWQNDLDLSRLIFLDESGAKTNMTRTYGRCSKSKRLFDKTLSGAWKTITMISSIDFRGNSRCMVIEGATTKVVFQKYLQEVLSCYLKPGDIVIMDNLSSHKCKEVKEIIELTGASVKYLPPYSPDLNPIEMMWSKVKAYLRKVKAKTKDILYEKIGKALRQVSAKDAEGWF